MLEQRNLERFDLSLTATIRIFGPKHEMEKEISNLLTKNICEGGAFFPTPQPLPRATAVQLDLILPLNSLKLKKIKEDWALIRADGTVSRTEPEGMAIRFSKYYTIQPHPSA